MYGWMIYPKETINNKFGNNAFDWMKESAFKNGICIDIVFSDELIILNNNNKTEFIYRDKSLKFPDFVIMRDYNYTISMQLENLGIRVINSTLSMFNSRSKAVTAQLLVKNNVSTPKFLFTKEKNYEFIHNYFYNRKFVMKENEGSQGKGVYLIEDEEEYNNVYYKINDEYFCQEFIEFSYGMDIRVYVLGDKVLGCVKRISDSSFKSNYSLGGRVEKYELTDSIKEISLSAAKAIGLEFCGIDLLFTKDSFTVCEVNGNAGFRTITMVSDIDIPIELFKWIKMP
ncbi:MAG: RimK family alpha-L-glutamate ligase [Tissierellia bacterium]|nr:RimK family alpha-L-glutamate ligase [Tissierellia bacterium]MDD3227166.1 RimK family alpha-L-glutamate ligase [Tissierellia bacterium]MDD4045771.1 RimK family alpha-L-glutamate ligase [Tissierellia bacterium]